MTQAPAGQQVDVGQLLDDGKLQGLPITVILFCAAALILDGFDIQAVSYAGPAIVADWGVSKAALGPVLAASLIGMGAGGLIAGPIGDRYGRKIGLIGSILLLSLATLLCSIATSMNELIVYRFIAGLGMGGVLPNMTALMAEYTPKRWRNLIVTIIIVGVPVGGMLGAEVAVHVLPVWGWRAIFVVGGVMPLALAFLMMLTTPESLRFLMRQPNTSDKVAKLVGRLAGKTYSKDDQFFLNEPKHESGGTVRALVSRDYLRDTLALWLTFFCVIFALFACVNWVPTLLTDLGFDAKSAANALFYFNLGGVLSTLLLGPVLIRFGSRPVLLVTAALGATAAFLLGHTQVDIVNGLPASDDWIILVAALLAAGGCIIGIQSCLYAVSANIYPTAFRSTGVGWGLGIGRLGGILSAFSGSIVLELGIGAPGFFTIVAGALVLAMAGMLILRRHVEPTL
jgi:MFS transporter, AAHS family, 4-hydroxybenzoate transporter